MTRKSCVPATCVKCGKPIQCSEVAKHSNWGSGRGTRWVCRECRSVGRWQVYYCRSACYYRDWRRSRAKPRKVVKSRKCAACRKPFTPQRSDARTCSNACRQARYRQSQANS